MKAFDGLQAKFMALIGLALAVMLAVLALIWQRQTANQTEVLRLSSDATRVLVYDRLRERGESQVTQTADLLVNPVYYFDLDAIGATTRSILNQPDVAYVLVYDAKGDILHDGSGDIPTFGKRMADPLAARIVAADGLRVLSRGDVMDVSTPILIGDQRLGGLRVGYSLAKLPVEHDHVCCPECAHVNDLPRVRKLTPESRDFDEFVTFWERRNSRTAGEIRSDIDRNSQGR